MILTMKNETFTFFSSVRSVQGEVTQLDRFVTLLKSAAHCKAIDHMQGVLKQGDKAEFDRLKRMLPAVTPNGVFVGGRQKQHLKEISGLKVFDFDHIEADRMQAVFEKATQLPGAALVAVSPSGEGIKLFLRVESELAMHDVVFDHLLAQLEVELGVEVDKSGRDINRLCFLPSPHGLYYNPEILPLDLSHIGTQADVAPPVENTPTSEIAVRAVNGIPPHVLSKLRMNSGIGGAAGVANAKIAGDFIQLQWRRSEALSIYLESKACFKEGERNLFAFKYASKACQCGIPRPIAQAWAEERYATEDFKVGEIIAAFGSGYTRNEMFFGRDMNRLQLAAQELQEPPFAEGDPSLEAGEVPSGEALYEYTPYLPDTIFEHLPQLFQDAIKPHRNRRQRDIMLQSALTVVSACMPGITGLYDGSEFSPHLYFFVVAKAASGKNMASQPFKMAHHYVGIIKAESERRIAQYVQDKANYDAYCLQMKSDKKPIDTSREPIEPYPVMPWIPANISRSMFIKQIVYNGSLGSFVLETEADALSVNRNTDWGDLSLLLRSAFHHERISMSRNGENKKEKMIEIEDPHFAIFVTGTPDQFVRLMGDADNGLYSRFCIYAFSEREKWHNPAPSSRNINLKQYYAGLSETLVQYALFSREHPAVFNLTEAQWVRFNAHMAPLLDKAQDYGFENEPSVVKRLGLILYRIAMTLSAVRRAEREIGSREFYCNDADFEAALAISETCLEHSRLMLSGFQKQDNFSDSLKKGISGPEEILAKLPDTFHKKDLIEVYKGLGRSETSCRRFMTSQIEAGTIVKQKHGVYKKTKQTVGSKQ